MNLTVCLIFFSEEIQCHQLFPFTRSEILVAGSQYKKGQEKSSHNQNQTHISSFFCIPFFFQRYRFSAFAQYTVYAIENG